MLGNFLGNVPIFNCPPNSKGMGLICPLGKQKDPAGWCLGVRVQPTPNRIWSDDGHLCLSHGGYGFHCKLRHTYTGKALYMSTVQGFH